MRKNAAAAHVWALLYLAFVVSAAPLALAQQNPPRTEIYGGYNWENPGGKLLTTPGGGMTNIGGMGEGFNIQSTFNFTPDFGLTVDSAANFKKGRANINTIMFRPTV